ncbi:MAG: AmmeMemoRadiSam system protein B [Candidatus Neomarinimicrobiota bacterium]|jgi:hypothetical protein|nr:AmmeMemoRadiSam system protein B [Candidatus Neomarinimicrobiota bacterium]MDX9779492.1 AmmeMemoRadiSam system protein B [bacterium]
MKHRKPAVAGQFYPASRESLGNLLEGLFRQAAADAPEIGEHIAGIVAPHAGYVYSGLQAARAFHYLQDRDYKTVCIISPSHREYFPGISVYPGEAYVTPLGELPVDLEGRRAALRCPGIFETEEGHRAEHALEVQLPFLQYALKDFSIIPLVMGDQSPQMLQLAASCVKQLHAQFGRSMLFVASSDLSHFHPAAEAAAMDTALIAMLDSYDDAGLEQALQKNEVEACGGGPLLALLRGLAKERHCVRTLGYRHSGQINHDKREVVGYTSALILEKGSDSAEGKH